MAAHVKEDFVPVEHDTFLDIVTNVVGILVILVMLVAMQARDKPAVASTGPAAPSPQLTAKRTDAAAMVREVQQLQIAGLQLASTLREREVERQYMATIKAKAESELAERKASLTTDAQRDFELRRRLVEATTKLDQLDRERVQRAAADEKVVEVKSYPTPLGKSVFGREVHFQLRGGRVAYLPIEELIEDAKNEFREKVWKLENQPEATELVGPRDGFRLRYTLERVDKMVDVPGHGQQRFVGAQAKQWELIPTDSSLGEPLAEVLAANSRFSQTLLRFDPAQTTVTLWTYPDSFGDYRKLKAELFRRGFSTAGRPLPEGLPIGGSPHGTRSSAE